MKNLVLKTWDRAHGQCRRHIANDMWRIAFGTCAVSEVAMYAPCENGDNEKTMQT
jgi:hypothetical protein